MGKFLYKVIASVWIAWSVNIILDPSTPNLLWDGIHFYKRCLSVLPEQPKLNSSIHFYKRGVSTFCKCESSKLGVRLGHFRHFCAATLNSELQEIIPIVYQLLTETILFRTRGSSVNILEMWEIFSQTTQEGWSDWRTIHSTIFYNISQDQI